jgi:hypothetical protein
LRSCLIHPYKHVFAPTVSTIVADVYFHNAFLNRQLTAAHPDAAVVLSAAVSFSGALHRLQSKKLNYAVI